MNEGFLSARQLLYAGPRGLTQAVERALWHLGFADVRLIDGSNDQGADLLAVRDREQWVVQCKWSSRGPIDRAGVDDAERARSQYQADRAVLATNTGLNRTAEDRRKALGRVGVKIAVWDGRTLQSIWDRMPDHVPSPYHLRPYQLAAAESVAADLKAHRRALLVLATGLGKTVVGGEVIRRHLSEHLGSQVLVVAHTKELVEQLEKAIWRHLDKTVPTQVLTGDSRPSTFEGVTIATIDSVLGVARAGWRPSMIMVDETHHVGDTGMFAQLLDLCDDACQFGVTATPWRGDKFDITARFGSPSYSLGIAQGMAEGYLAKVDYRIFVDNLDWDFVRSVSEHGYSIKELNRALFLPQRDGEIIDQVRLAWREINEPRAILFCQTIEHAERMANLLSGADQSWRRAACLHSGLSRQRRQVLLNAFRLGRVPIITCVDVFNEGVDVPDVNLIGFLRVTHSRRIFVQQLGRGLRLREGKEFLRVLDFVTDVRRVAATLDLRRSLGALRGTELEELSLPGGSSITFSDETAGSLLDYWIKDAASLETAAPTKWSCSSLRQTGWTDMALPEEVETRIVTRLFQDADQMDWAHLTGAARAAQYAKWVQDPEVGGRLAAFMTAGQARVWIKDGPMKEWARAVSGIGKYAPLVAERGLTASELVVKALGPGWRPRGGTQRIKPLRINAIEEEEEVTLAWGPERDLKHLVWAALSAGANGDPTPWVLCVVSTFTSPVPANTRQLHLRLATRCALRLVHVTV